ncbi:MAG: AtpZ/AtpI family protein [Patescibacteria group bacterium]
MENNSPLIKKSMSPWQALNIVWDILLAIAVPTVIFGLGGRYLDKRYDTSPIFLILGLAMSLALVSVIVTRKAKDIAKRL